VGVLITEVGSHYLGRREKGGQEGRPGGGEKAIDVSRFEMTHDSPGKHNNVKPRWGCVVYQSASRQIKREHVKGDKLTQKELGKIRQRKLATKTSKKNGWGRAAT